MPPNDDDRARRLAASPGSTVVDRPLYDRRVSDHELTTLPTGERVITERIPGVRSVALGFWIGAGSRNEPDAKAGVSHFIEHLLFKGSSRYSAQQIAEIFDGLGGELNAATSRETTVVYARVPDERLETAVDVMADMVFEPAFVEVDAEREVVLEEIAMVEDNPQDLVHDIVAEAVFGSHPLGRPVIGRAEVIAGVSRRSLAAYHRGAYVGSNIVVAAAGNLEHGRLVELLSARRSGPEQPLRLTRKALSRPPLPGLRFQEKPTEQYHVCLGARGVSRMDERRFAASLLDAIVGGSASSRLFQEIREKRGMAYAVYSFGSQYSDAGQVGVYIGTREENLGACLEIAAEQLADVAAGNVRSDELERAKENLKGRLLLSLESTSNRMSRLGKSLVTGGELLSTEQVVERVEAVSADGIAALAAELLAPERLSAAAIGPSEDRFHAAVRHVNPALLARAA
jgi:predicted Zn-dependent peptidase